jgi:hypothetical protein
MSLGEARMRGPLAGVLFGVVLAASVAWAQPISRQAVQFKPGKSGATLKGQIKGREIVDYTLSARTGQSLVVIFTPTNKSAYFNVLPPGSEAAIFIGSTLGNRFEGDLPSDGTYTVRVYLMSSAARRNEAASYTLEVGISGGTKTPTAAAAPRAAGPAKWDASGDVQCSLGSASFNKQCGFRVVRNLGRQSADIWVAHTGRDAAEYRFFHYENRVFTTNDKAKLAWQRQDDNWLVSVDGKEFYWFPDALIHGGRP